MVSIFETSATLALGHTNRMRVKGGVLSSTSRPKENHFYYCLCVICRGCTCTFAGHAVSKILPGSWGNLFYEHEYLPVIKILRESCTNSTKVPGTIASSVLFIYVTTRQFFHPTYAIFHINKKRLYYIRRTQYFYTSSTIRYKIF